MRRTLLCGLLLAATLSAETVWLSAKGKTYHANPQCMALSHTANKLSAERAAATAHGLKPCGICFRPKTAKKARLDNPGWAKEGK